MRQQLEFVWRAFYNAADADHELPNTKQVFKRYTDSIPETPFCDLFLLVVSDFSKSLPDAIPIQRTSFADVLMPCDNLFLLDRDNAHYATLWKIKPEKDSALILDPFPEFWNPEQNSSISTWKIVDYKHSRQLVKVKLSELLQCLVAVFAIRDK